jgi:hypothetical protein
MTISIPAASAACRAAQFRGLILGPVEGIRVPSMSIAISWMLTPLFYLFLARLPGSVSKWEPLRYHRFMPSIAYLECTRCHTHFSAETAQTVCPLCAGVLLVGHEVAASGEAGSGEEEVDHRGVVLPKRHRAGGIITPQ